MIVTKIQLRVIDKRKKLKKGGYVYVYIYNITDLCIFRI